MQEFDVRDLFTSLLARFMHNTDNWYSINHLSYCRNHQITNHGIYHVCNDQLRLQDQQYQSQEDHIIWS